MGLLARVLKGLRRPETEDTSVETMRARALSAEPRAEPVVATQPDDQSFRMPVQDVFTITRRGTVVTGLVEAGVAEVGQEVRVMRDATVVATTTITAIEKFRAQLDSARVGETVGLLLASVTRQDVQPGDVVQG